MPQPVTNGQKEFFENLLTQKRFPDGQDKSSLRNQFGTLDTKNASAWIEKALTLPDAEDAPTVAAPF